MELPVSGTVSVRTTTGGYQAVPVKHAFLDVNSGSTHQEIVAAVTGKSIRVLSVVGLAGGTPTDLTFYSDTTAISCKLANAANGGEVLPNNVHGWFETAAGKNLNVTTSAGSTTGIMVNYVEVP